MANPLGESSLEELHQHVLLHIMGGMEAKDVCVAACSCSMLRDAAAQPSLWRQLWQRDCSSVAHHFPEVEGTAPESPSWRALVPRGHQLLALRTGKWARLRQRAGPTPREGHAAQPWGPPGRGGLILFGGWGGGIRNDTWVLGPEGGRDCGSNSSPGSEDGGGDGGGRLAWSRLHAKGPPPAIRYGHSVTRCGRGFDMLFVYGGMQVGGYSGEIDAPGLLRPITKASADAATDTTTDAATSGNAGSSSYAVAADTGGGSGGGGGDGGEPRYEWVKPRLHGDEPVERGYHAACASEDGSKVFLFGGIRNRGCCATLAIIDVDTWQGGGAGSLISDPILKNFSV
ncbi:hypothetical protein FOA52_000800 [Chlamydomonas sp. UWO 241]|nr:hypothetical protein FOA52_000800 [Chlamydomonas sp. UWO 241]